MNKSLDLVSVIINCYNGEKYLKDAINSVKAQSYHNWEIIFWDNQSQDASSKIVQFYNDERIKYYYASEHTPLGEARNRAVEKASGVWIAILDCDDFWQPSKLEEQLNGIDNSIGIIYSKASQVVEVSGADTLMGKSANGYYFPKRDKLPSGNIFENLLFDCFVPCPSVLIRRDLYLKVGGIDRSLKVAEDYDIFLKVAKISKCHAVDKILCTYRIHANNLSHENLDITFEESIKVVSHYKNIKNIQMYINYWRLKYLKNLIKSKNYKKIFRNIKLINLYYLIIALIYRYI